MNVETGFIIDDTNKMERKHLEIAKKEKEFVKYYFPSEKFVPIDQLPVVSKYYITIFGKIILTTLIYFDKKKTKQTFP